MSTINASLKLINFEKEFNQNIIREIKNLLNLKMPSIVIKIKDRLKVELKNSISQSNTWQEVYSGMLRGELGIQNTGGLDNILDTWANGIMVKFNNNALGSIDIGMIQSDYSDVLTMPEASFAYASKNTSGVIEWLRWLLLESSSIIVSSYDFTPSNKGRTGLGIMKRNAGGWRVPAEHAGSATDNFVTRSLQDINKIIDEVVRQEITKGL